MTRAESEISESQNSQTQFILSQATFALFIVFLSIGAVDLFMKDEVLAKVKAELVAQEIDKTGIITPSFD